MKYLFNLSLNTYNEFNSLNIDIKNFDILITNLFELNYKAFHNFIVENYDIYQNFELCIEVEINLSETSILSLRKFCAKLFLSEGELMKFLLIFCINNKYLIE